eukprot:15443570-Alexandrium_andersonii.AAC.1
MGGNTHRVTAPSSQTSIACPTPSLGGHGAQLWRACTHVARRPPVHECTTDPPWAAPRVGRCMPKAGLGS